jgi:hypothetical protein
MVRDPLGSGFKAARLPAEGIDRLLALGEAVRDQNDKKSGHDQARRPVHGKKPRKRQADKNHAERGKEFKRAPGEQKRHEKKDGRESGAGEKNGSRAVRDRGVPDEHCLETEQQNAEPNRREQPKIVGALKLSGKSSEPKFSGSPADFSKTN